MRGKIMILMQMLWLHGWYGPCCLRNYKLHHSLTSMCRTRVGIHHQKKSGHDQGWGLLSQFPPFHYFPNFSVLSKQTLVIECHVYIWQVSPQLGCGDTFQIWMWFEEHDMYFCHIENFAYGEIDERSFGNPHPRNAHGVKPKSILGIQRCL